MKYAELPLRFPEFAGHLQALTHALTRALILASAVVIAVLVSGGIFNLTPLVGISLAHTQGTSMEPKQKNGDVVLLKAIDGANARVGDVVVFQEKGKSFMHRLIERRLSDSGELMLVTQGDNVPVPDHPILASQVTNRMIGEVPLLGAFSRLLHGDGGIHAYRSIVISISLFSVALWGLVTSARAERRPVRRHNDTAGLS